jgi:tRNA(His) guanylyltransferase
MKEGFNPMTNQQVFTERQRIKIDLELPMYEEYSEFIKNLIETVQLAN